MATLEDLNPGWKSGPYKTPEGKWAINPGDPSRPFFDPTFRPPVDVWPEYAKGGKYNPPNWLAEDSPFQPVGTGRTSSELEFEANFAANANDPAWQWARQNLSQSPRPAFPIPGLDPFTLDLKDPQEFSANVLPHLLRAPIEGQNRTEQMARTFLKDEPGQRMSARAGATTDALAQFARRQGRSDVSRGNARTRTQGVRNIVRAGTATQRKIKAGEPGRRADATGLYAQLGPLAAQLVGMYLSETGRNAKIAVASKAERDRKRKAAIGSLPIVGQLGEGILGFID